MSSQERFFNLTHTHIAAWVKEQRARLIFISTSDRDAALHFLDYKARAQSRALHKTHHQQGL
jgi:hypothetical protein